MELSRPILIGIAGGTASGKTSVAEILKNDFIATNSVTIIKEDDYYKDQSSLTYEERCKVNYDHPLAFDFDLMTTQLKELLAGKTIRKPTYDYTVHNRSEVIETVEPSDVIILEGLFALYNPEIRQLEDIKVFIDTDADKRFIRRLKRDVKERQRTIESVMDQYLATVKPMHDQFIEPTKKYANIIIPDGITNEVGVDILRSKINSVLYEKML